MKRKTIVLLLLSFIFALTGCTAEPITQKLTAEPIVQPTELPASELTVHFIDVGQADAALLQCDGAVMLIDSGNVADSNLIIAYLKKLNIESIDYMICTHAHEDHVGGLSAPLSVMPVGAVYAPVTETDSKAYQTFKQKVYQKNLKISHPAPNETLSLGSAKAEFIAPISEDAYNINNTSIVLKITYGNTSFLFTGDAEREEEQEILNSGYDISADVLKVGHHGSDTSTSYVFLREVMPKYAVISCGKGNQYGHPTEAVLSRLRDADVEVYRTDLQGDIVAVSNGENITLSTKSLH